MTSEWTSERIENLIYIARDVYTQSPVINELCDILEAQQAEIEKLQGAINDVFVIAGQGHNMQKVLNRLNQVWE